MRRPTTLRCGGGACRDRTMCMMRSVPCGRDHSFFVDLDPIRPITLGLMRGITNLHHIGDPLQYRIRNGRMGTFITSVSSKKESKKRNRAKEEQEERIRQEEKSLEHSLTRKKTTSYTYNRINNKQAMLGPWLGNGLICFASPLAGVGPFLSN